MNSNGMQTDRQTAFQLYIYIYIDCDFTADKNFLAIYKHMDLVLDFK